ncbi:MAG: OsmC family protein [Anaerolineales bacterium]
MQIDVDFPGGARVDAHFSGFTVHTDQTVRDGGDGTAPSPFDLFLASTAACAGFYVQRFCQQRQIPTAELHLIQRLEVDPATGHVTKLLIEIQLPPGFPPKYQAAVIRAAEQCTVKKHLEHPPEFEIAVNWHEPVAG